MNELKARQRAPALVAALALLIVVGLARTSGASVVGPSVEPTVTILVDGSEDWRDIATVEIDALEFDADPFVLLNANVTNNTNDTQTFTLSISLPTVFAAPNVISGQVTATVLDGDLNGAMFASAGSPIYQAFIDLLSVASLLDDPFELSATDAGSSTASASFGPQSSSISVASSIGLGFRFSLSAHDSASIGGRFDVVDPVPEPATIVLLGSGLLGLAGIGRQRRKKSLSL